MKLFFDKDSLKYEYTYPYIGSFICILILGLLYYKFPEICTEIFPKNNELFAASLTFFGILLGFLATTKALLLGMKSDVIEKLTESNLMPRLIDYSSQTIWMCIFTCIVNIVCFFIKKDSAILQFLWYIATILSIFLFIRVTNTLLQILKTHYKSSEERSRKEAEKKKTDILSVDINNMP